MSIRISAMGLLDSPLLLGAIGFYIIYKIISFVRTDCDLLLAGKADPQRGTFTNKVVWITGGSSGIGKAIAEAFAAHKAKIIISSRDLSRLGNVKNELIKNYGLEESNVTVLPLDLSDLDSIPAIVNQAVKVYGRVDVLVNNGGISMRARSEDSTFDVDAKVFTVDFLGQVRVTKALLPTLIAQKSGHIINISSVAGKVGSNLRTAYCAAKFAMIGYFDALRMEQLENNVHVTNVCPGYVQSEVSKHALDAKGESYGVTEKQIAQGMPASLCAKLILRAVHHRLDEVWIARQPELFFVYLAQYCPTLAKKLQRTMAKKIELNTLKQIEEARKAASTTS